MASTTTTSPRSSSSPSDSTTPSKQLSVKPLLEHTGAVWVAPVLMRPCDDDIKIDSERADSDSAKDDGGAERCRHPFGLHNPPEKVWEAHRRLAPGVKDLKDEEWVSAYAAMNTYHGKGLGQYESMSRRFQVRRPRYSPGLAKERGIKKELKSEQSKIDTGDST